MTDGGLRDRGNPDDGEQPVEQFQRQFQQRGSGMALYFPSRFVNEYRLNSETDVDVQVVEENGDVSIQIKNLPAGFGYDALKEFADAQGWEQVDEYAEAETDEWYLTYRTGNGAVRVEIDSEAQIDGSAVNNVVVRSEPVHVTGDLDRYNRLLAIATRKDLRVQVTDSQGLWQRLRSSAERSTDDAPDEETFQQISDAAGRVTAAFVCQRSSMKTSLDDLRVIVGKIEAAYEELDED